MSTVSRVTPLSVIETALQELAVELHDALPGPAVRELRVRHVGLSRVVRGWTHLPPHDDQLAAMLECVLELHSKVLRACGTPARDASPMARRASGPLRFPASARASVERSRTTRPPPAYNASTRTTRPPSRLSDGPPFSRH